MHVIQRRDRRIFRQLCDVLDTEKTTNRSTNRWNNSLHMYAMIGGLAVDAMRSEGAAMMEGRSDDVFLSFKAEYLIMEYLLEFYTNYVFDDALSRCVVGFVWF
mmetsp:Transcript_7475/g.20811  ORF Transcript_7475/g.20811 Transcript_7475/m.20811 type:complete len:103 (+) Transcript_7475:5291-5599(+)